MTIAKGTEADASFQDVVENRQVEGYVVFLKEKHRPPSRGGNTRALHAHVLTIDGEKYSFLALGARKWVYRSDTVSFKFVIKDGYRNIVKETLVCIGPTGIPVVRGDRGSKPKLRTADTRMPVSRREQRD